MYITLEKQYQFFKFLQECNYPNSNSEQIKRAWNIIEPGMYLQTRQEMVNNKFPGTYIKDMFLAFVNMQIELYQNNVKIVSETNSKLDKLCPTGDKSGDKLTQYHNKKLGIETKKKDDFSYNNTNIGEISSCLASAIGSLYSSNLGGIENIMDFKDCNIQIARDIKNKYDAVSEK